jgi:hypothetical protein
MSGRPKDVVWEHGENLAPGWRCNYCGMQKSGGGSTRFKKHMAACGSSVLHCEGPKRRTRGGGGVNESR